MKPKKIREKVNENTVEIHCPGGCLTPTIRGGKIRKEKRVKNGFASY